MNSTELDKALEENINLLDLKAKIPAGFADRVIENCQEFDAPPTLNRNLSSWIQTAAAVMIGIFMGHLLGRNAHALPVHKGTKKGIEKYDMQPFSTDYSGMDFRPFKL